MQKLDVDLRAVSKQVQGEPKPRAPVQSGAENETRRTNRIELEPSDFEPDRLQMYGTRDALASQSILQRIVLGGESIDESGLPEQLALWEIPDEGDQISPDIHDMLLAAGATPETAHDKLADWQTHLNRIGKRDQARFLRGYASIRGKFREEIQQADPATLTEEKAQLYKDRTDRYFIELPEPLRQPVNRLLSEEKTVSGWSAEAHYQRIIQNINRLGKATSVPVVMRCYIRPLSAGQTALLLPELLRIANNEKKGKPLNRIDWAIARFLEQNQTEILGAKWIEHDRQTRAPLWNTESKWGEWLDQGLSRCVEDACAGALMLKRFIGWLFWG